MSKKRKTNEEYRQQLSDEQYRVTQDKGTEPAFTGEYNDFKGEGMYRCVCCGAPLFDSSTKFDSGSGWPSFFAAVSDKNVATASDSSHGMIRTEATCGECDAHLGHVFDDGPQPTGQRFCINSAALDFDPDKKDE